MAKGAFAKTWPAKLKDNRSDEIKYRLMPTCYACPSDGLATQTADGKRKHSCADHLNNPPQESDPIKVLLAQLGLL